MNLTSVTFKLQVEVLFLSMSGILIPKNQMFCSLQKEQETVRILIIHARVLWDVFIFYLIMILSAFVEHYSDNSKFDEIILVFVWLWHYYCIVVSLPVAAPVNIPITIIQSKKSCMQNGHWILNSQSIRSKY